MVCCLCFVFCFVRCLFCSICLLCSACLFVCLFDYCCVFLVCLFVCVLFVIVFLMCNTNRTGTLLGVGLAAFTMSVYRQYIGLFTAEEVKHEQRRQASERREREKMEEREGLDVEMVAMSKEQTQGLLTQHRERDRDRESEPVSHARKQLDTQSTTQSDLSGGDEVRMELSTGAFRRALDDMRTHSHSLSQQPQQTDRETRDEARTQTDSTHTDAKSKADASLSVNIVLNRDLMDMRDHDSNPDELALPSVQGHGQTQHKRHSPLGSPLTSPTHRI